MYSYSSYPPSYNYNYNYPQPQQQPRVVSVVAKPTDPTLYRSCYYLRGAPGILRLIEIIFSFICLVTSCVITARFLFLATHFEAFIINGISASTFLLCISLICFLCMMILFFLHLTQCIQPQKHLIITDIIFCCVWTVLFFIASVVIAVYISPYGYDMIIYGAQIVACIFGFLMVIILLIHILIHGAELRQAKYY